MADEYDDDLSFEDIRNRAREEIKEPPILPAGYWRFKVNGGKLAEVKGRGEKAPKAEAIFMLKPIEPGDDVAPAEAEALDATALDAARISFRIPIFRRSDEWNVRRFIENVLGADFEGTLEEACGHAKGYEFMGQVSHRPNNDDPDHPYVDVKAPVRVD